MPTKSKQENGRHRLPQVGALLRFNSFLPPESDPDRRSGSRDWDLEGGAILVAPDRVLTTGHVMQTMPPELAIFIPGHGIVPIVKGDIVWENERVSENEELKHLDWLVLLRLEREITGLPPLAYDYLSRKSIGMQRITTYGWGDWRVGDDEEDYFADGIQRRRTFALMDPKKHGYSPLDLVWSTGLKAPFALRNNSGGAVLGLDERQDPYLVGVMRAFKGDRHYASRIGTVRMDWLNSQLGPIEPTPDPVPPRFSEGNIVLDERPYLVSHFTLPEGTRKVRATASASAGLFVQMGLSTAPLDNAACQALAQNYDRSGRFLYRELEVSPKDTMVHLGVVSLAEGPEKSKHVEVQTCIAFDR